MKYLILTLLLSITAHATTIKIAIIDTGYKAALIDGPKLKLCATGHYDFVKNTPTIGYGAIHGTDVASIIAEELADIDYCAIIYTVYDEKLTPTIPDLFMALAYNKALKDGAKVINLSIVSKEPSQSEKKAVTELARHAEVFAAAGNDKLNLDNNCKSYPVCFWIPGVNPVGASDGAKYTNYGKKVKLWYSGKGTYGNGTSLSVPRAVADFVRLVATKTP
jgi:hypothetical protein